ncbi:MAG: amino acid permease [Burkholderiales bacterium]|nr:amino acid permease [Burkholderiales bacterium]
MESKTSDIESSSDNNKKIGLWICSALVMGNMVGSGIFLLPASLAPYGGVSILGWAVTTFGAMMTALVFVRLSRRFPRQGGPYRYSYDHLGSFAGFSVAWSYWVSIWCGNAAIAVAGITYLSFFFPNLQQDTYSSLWLTLVILWSLTFLNTRGVKQAGIFQLVATGLKLLPLIAIGIMCFWTFDPVAFSPLNPTDQPLSSSIVATAALTLWAFLGLESATIPADNVESPGKTIPRSTLIGVSVVAIIYMTSQVTIMSVVPNAELQTSGAPFADAASILWGEFAGYIVAAGAVVSCFGALNGWILLQGQVPMSAARDGLLPKFLSDQKNDGLSIGALIFSSVIISVLIIANYNEGLVSLFTFAILMSTLGIFVPYLLSIVVDIKLLIEEKRLAKSWLSVVSALLAMLYCVWAISGIGSKALLWGVVLILSGIPVYLWMRLRG